MNVSEITCNFARDDEKEKERRKERMNE